MELSNGLISASNLSCSPGRQPLSLDHQKAISSRPIHGHRPSNPHSEFRQEQSTATAHPWSVGRSWFRHSFGTLPESRDVFGGLLKLSAEKFARQLADFRRPFLRFFDRPVCLLEVLSMSALIVQARSVEPLGRRSSSRGFPLPRFGDLALSTHTRLALHTTAALTLLKPLEALPRGPPTGGKGEVA